MSFSETEELKRQRDNAERALAEAADEIERLRAQVAALREALRSLVHVAQSLLEQAQGMTFHYEAEDVYLHGVPQLLQEAPRIIDASRAALGETI